MRLFTLFIFLFFSSSAFSQDIYTSEYESSPDPNRFYSEIQSFLNEDIFIKSNKKLIVFTGSSSIRFWMGLKNDFSEYDMSFSWQCKEDNKIFFFQLIHFYKN